MEQIINALRSFGSENGNDIANFVINLSQDLAHFFPWLIWIFSVIGFVIFVSIGFDFKNRAAREAAGQRVTTGGMVAKVISSVLLAQMVVFVRSLAESVAGNQVTVMTPYSYVEQMTGQSTNVWGDMLLAVMGILTLMAWFYMGKALVMLGKLDSAPDREARLNGSIITALAATILLIIADVASAVASSGGLQVDSGGGML